MSSSLVLAAGGALRLKMPWSPGKIYSPLILGHPVPCFLPPPLCLAAGGALRLKMPWPPGKS